LSPTQIKFKPIIKDRLYYDRFSYCIGFQLDEVNCLRTLSHAGIADLIERRLAWQEISQQRWVNGHQNHSTIMARRWKEITAKTIADLHELAEMLLVAKEDFKLVVTVNQGYVYTNNISLVRRLDRLSSLQFKTYTEATIDRPKNTIRLKKPRHQYRSYLKTVKLTAEQKKQLVNFLKNQQENIRTSPSLTAWFDKPFNRTQDYFFIDYDHIYCLTMLALIHSGLIRKSLEIIPAK
jgi:hypothetical protein